MHRVKICTIYFFVNNVELKSKNNNKIKVLAVFNEYLLNIENVPTIDAMCETTQVTRQTFYNYLKDENFDFNNHDSETQISIIINEHFELKNFTQVYKRVYQLKREWVSKAYGTIHRVMKRDDGFGLNAAEKIIKLLGTPDERKRLNNFNMELENKEQDNRIVITLPEK